METIGRLNGARAVPATQERAFTELAQCRRHLEKAVESLEVAVEIFSRLNGTGSLAVDVLDDALARMEEVEAAVRTVPFGSG